MGLYGVVEFYVSIMENQMEKQMDNGMGTEVCRYVWLGTLRSVLHPLRIMSQSGPQLSLHHDRGGGSLSHFPQNPHIISTNLYVISTVPFS